MRQNFSCFVPTLLKFILSNTGRLRVPVLCAASAMQRGCKHVKESRKAVVLSARTALPASPEPAKRKVLLPEPWRSVAPSDWTCPLISEASQLLRKVHSPS